MKTTRIWLRLSPALIDGLDEIAKKEGYSSRQEVIRVIIHDAVLKERGIIVG
jgi:metal-responsive CopG/Arc/MetJ family transcriptional regulator